MSNVNIWLWVLALIIAYLLGNISPSTLLAKAKGIDIHKEGSGNAGTTNALRVMGKKAGVITLVVDVLKGTIAVLIGFLLAGSAGETWCVLAVFCGHVWPVFYKFKGGKGVACILGVFAVAEPLWAAVAFLGCFLYLLIFDYGAMASFIFITCLTVIEAYKFRGNIPICTLLFILFFLTWFMHRQNIFRLLIGKENKVNLAKAIKKLKSKPKLTKNERQDAKEQQKQKEIG